MIISLSENNGTGETSNAELLRNKKQRKLFNNLSKKSSLFEIQEYINKVLGIRGFNGQLIQDKMLLLSEEVGELAKAIRKNLPNASVDYSKIINYDSVESELADVLIVLLSVCNKLNIDIYTAFIEKEKQNINRKWKINKNTNL